MKTKNIALKLKDLHAGRKVYIADTSGYIIEAEIKTTSHEDECMTTVVSGDDVFLFTNKVGRIKRSIDKRLAGFLGIPDEDIDKGVVLINYIDKATMVSLSVKAMSTGYNDYFDILNSVIGCAKFTDVNWVSSLRTTDQADAVVSVPWEDICPEKSNIRIFRKYKQALRYCKEHIAIGDGSTGMQSLIFSRVPNVTPMWKMLPGLATHLAGKDKFIRADIGTTAIVDIDEPIEMVRYELVDATNPQSGLPLDKASCDILNDELLMGGALIDISLEYISDGKVMVVFKPTSS